MNNLDLKLLDRIFKLARKRGVSRLTLNDGQLEVGFELFGQELSTGSVSVRGSEDDGKPDAPPTYTDDEFLFWSANSLPDVEEGTDE